ncbi:MAG: CotH kinase family protein [Bacteroidetes bacterium]|nr:CotH kinase family protein [Bacteroidota bacterium]
MLKRSFLLLLIVILIPPGLLRAQSDDSWKIYSDTSVARIDITIDPTALQWIYANEQSDSEHVASVRFRNRWLDESVDSIGFRLRGNTSRAAKKKSFKVSFNSFLKGRKFHGVEKLNLNGEHNDPSIIRSKLSFDMFRDLGITATRANHARVFINGGYYGLYVNVEHVDENFLARRFADDGGTLWKCLYPADLKYLGTDPDLYKKVMNNATTRAYELSQGTGDDYTPLARLIAIVNNTTAGALPDSLERVMDIQRLLQYFAVNTLVGSWDDYRSLMNNYYLYLDPQTRKFIVIPYDYDNTFGVDWFSVNWSAANPYSYPKAAAGSRPLWDRIITIPQYRDLYTHFLRFSLDTAYALRHWESRLDRLKDSILSAALEDTYRTMDYGFTIADFMNSFGTGPYSKQHVKMGLKQFVNARSSSLPAQLTSVTAPPMVYRIGVIPSVPSPTDSLTVQASAYAAIGLRALWVQYTPAGGTAQLHPMQRTPVPGTRLVEEADRWTAVLPPLGPGGNGTFRIVAEDSLSQSSVFPRSGSVRVSAPDLPGTSVVINEFMADNTTIPDPSGQYDDWVELYNPTAAAVTITGKYLTDKATSLTKYRFTQPGLSIPPGGYLMVWCDEELTQPGVHANIKLSAGGEFLALTDSDGVTVLDSISFGPQTANISMGRLPNGSGPWTSMAPTPLASNGSVAAVEGEEMIPRTLTLSAYPNPFNPVTTFRFTVPADAVQGGSGGTAPVVLELYTMLGERAATVLQDHRPAGTYAVEWNAARFASGVYIAVMRAGPAVRQMKVVLLK